MKRVSSFLTSGLGTSRPEAIRQRAEASGPQRVDLPDTEGGLSRPLPLWSVLEGLAGREKLRPKHLPSLGPAGGPGQVQPHVGRLSAFLSDSGLVMSYSAGPQRAGSRLWQGKGGHYKGAIRGPFPPQLGGWLRVQGCATIYPRGAPSIFLTGVPGTRSRGLRPVSRGQRKEEVQAVPGVKVRKVDE